jgi:hypothetical protein
MNVSSLASKINKAAGSYWVGGLQELRRDLGRNPRTGKIFTKSTIKPTYAFHDGGRRELQFNIGLEDGKSGRYWRHGVAFSFETSITLPNPADLLPKVHHFNDWLSKHADELSGFKMWHEASGEVSKDRTPGAIPDELVRPGVFVFLGRRVPEEKVDVVKILEDLDRLFPLYIHVESDPDLAAHMIALPEELPAGSSYTEGSVQRVLVNRYERDPKARKACLAKHGLACVVCGFDFAAVYGPDAKGVIHVHHLKPLSKIGQKYKLDPEKDLQPVCPNCHAVIHQGGGCRGIEDVKDMVKQHGKFPAS